MELERPDDDESQLISHASSDSLSDDGGGGGGHRALKNGGSIAERSLASRIGLPFVYLTVGIILGLSISAATGTNCIKSESDLQLGPGVGSEIEELRAQLNECQEKSGQGHPPSGSIRNDTKKEESGAESKGRSSTFIPKEETSEEKLQRLRNALVVIDEEQQKILDMYDLTSEQAQKSVWYGGEGSRAKQQISDRILTAVSQRSGQFHMAFTGMSVCAGHGSYFNESYPMVVESTLKKVFGAANVRFGVRNACMGGTYTYPYSWCMSNIVGADVDVVAWDFGMMEAGRSHFTEGWLQQVLKIESKPAILFMAGYANQLLDDSSGGAISSQNIPALDQYRRGVAIHYGRVTGAPVHAFWSAPTLRERYTQVKIPDSERGKGGWDNFIELRSKSDHPTPEALTNLRWYSRKGLPGQASWHPAPKEHQIFGKLLSFNYMDMLKSAIEKEIERLSASPIPPPLNLKKLLQSQVTDFHDSRKCKDYKELFCHTAFHCSTSYEPRQGRGLIDLIKNDNYKKVLAPADNTAIEEVKRFGTGYLDRKYAYKGSRADGPLSFRLHHVKAGTVIVCEPTYGWRKPHNIIDLASEVEFFIDTHKVKLADPDGKVMKGIAKNCVVVTYNCPQGGHDLVMEPTVDGKDLYVSFVLWN